MAVNRPFLQSRPAAVSLAQFIAASSIHRERVDVVLRAERVFGSLESCGDGRSAGRRA